MTQTTIIAGLGLAVFFNEHIHADPAVWLSDDHDALDGAGGRPLAPPRDPIRPDRQGFPWATIQRAADSQGDRGPARSISRTCNHPSRPLLGKGPWYPHRNGTHPPFGPRLVT